MVATRALDGAVGPLWLGALRYATGAMVLLIPWLLMRGGVVAWRDLPGVMAVGAIQFGVLIALLNCGLERVAAGTAALLFATFPLMTLLLVAATGQDRLTAAKLGGTVLALVGIGVAVGPGGAADPLGALAVLGAALSGAVAAVLTRPYLARYSLMRVGPVSMLGAVVALGPMAALGGPLPAMDVREWTLVLGIGLSSGLAYWLWLAAIKLAEPAPATLLLGLSPIAAGPLGALFLGETVGLPFWIGCALTLGGIAVALGPRRRLRRAS